MTVDTDVVIRRCTVTVTRHGGWCWGGPLRLHTDRILAMLPALINDRYPGVAAAGGDPVEIVEPVVLTVRLPLRQLLAIPAPTPTTTTAPAPVSATATDPAMPAAGGDHELDLVEESVAIRRPGPPAMPEDSDEEAETAESTGLLAMLARMHRRGRLDTLLALLPPAVLEAWYAALIRPSAGRPAHGEVLAHLRLVHREGLLAALAAAVPGQIRRGWRRALTGAGQPVDGPLRAASARDHETTPDLDPARRHRADIATIVAVAVRVGETATQSLLAAEPDSERPGSQRPLDVADPLTAAAPRPEAVEVDIESALPFLLLGPLAQDGYLDSLAAGLDLAGPADHGGVLAAVLASTVVPASDPVVPLFAGLARAPGADETNAFATRGRDMLPALDAVLTASLAAGHDPDTPIVLSADGDSILAADLDGLFPMAWAAGVAELLPLWRACGSPPCVVTPAAATPAVLRDLDRGGVPFAVTVPPTRRERWRRRPGPDPWWGNADGPVRCDGELLAWASAGLDELLRELAPADCPDRRLRRSSVLAAAYALGSIAWSLWRQRESAHPLLARDRFAGLPARVRVDAHAVHLFLPLGRRLIDLRDNGWLDDVPGVPWLGGRTVRFSEG